jgi:hypothetical protein
VTNVKHPVQILSSKINRDKSYDNMCRLAVRKTCVIDTGDRYLIPVVIISAYAAVAYVRINVIRSRSRSMPKKNTFALIFFHINTFILLFYFNFFRILYYVNALIWSFDCHFFFLFLLPLVCHGTNLSFLKLFFEMIVNN